MVKAAVQGQGRWRGKTPKRSRQAKANEKMMTLKPRPSLLCGCRFQYGCGYGCGCIRVHACVCVREKTSSQGHPRPSETHIPCKRSTSTLVGASPVRPNPTGKGQHGFYSSQADIPQHGDFHACVRLASLPARGCLFRAQKT